MDAPEIRFSSVCDFCLENWNQLQRDSSLTQQSYNSPRTLEAMHSGRALVLPLIPPGKLLTPRGTCLVWLCCYTKHFIYKATKHQSKEHGPLRHTGAPESIPQGTPWCLSSFQKLLCVTHALNNSLVLGTAAQGIVNTLNILYVLTELQNAD